MQLTTLPSIYSSLVPNSTRPVWHQWHQQNNNFENNKENILKNNINFKNYSTARRRLIFENEENKNYNKQNKQFVKNLLSELSEHFKQKWGFDFDECKPLEGKENNCRFEFEQISANKVPEFYRTTKTLKYKNNKPEQNDENNKTLINCCSDLNNCSDKLKTTKTNCLAKSPIRSLMKPPFHLNSGRTPTTRRRLSLNICNNKLNTFSSNKEEKQTKITDFLSVRKSFSPSNFKSVKFEKIGDEDNEIKIEKVILESPKKRRLNLKKEKGKKIGKIDISEGNNNTNIRRSLRLKRLYYARNTTI